MSKPNKKRADMKRLGEKFPLPKNPKLNPRRIVRGPLFWIVIALLAVSFFGRITTSGEQFVKVDTSTLLAAIASDKAESALIIDKDQKVEVVLKKGNYIKGSNRIYASYVAREEPAIVELLTSNPPTKAWDVKVPTTSFLASLFMTFFPLLLVAFILILFMGNAQGGIIKRCPPIPLAMSLAQMKLLQN
jgi:cell division protease FtsH